MNQPPLAPTSPTLQIEEKHPLAIRWMHWICFPVLFAMIWSGLIIYWSDSAPGYTYEHQVYRVGFGSFTLFRLFPPWFDHLFKLDSHEASGLGLHAFFMWIFALNGLAYVVFLAISGQWRSIVPDRRALQSVGQTLRAEILGRPIVHPGTKYNAAQRVAYTAVILMGVGALVSGIAIWKPTTMYWLTALLGGYENARWLHFWLTIGFCVFFFVHVLQVLRAGWNTLRAMICGAQIVPIAEPSAPDTPAGAPSA